MIVRLPSEARLIGPALRDLRVMLGVKQKDLVAAGVGQQNALSDLENGRVAPLVGTILKYLAALDCQLGAVFAEWKKCQCGRLVNKQGVWCCRMCRDTYGTHSSLCRRRNSGEVPRYTTDKRGHVRESAGE